MAEHSIPCLIAEIIQTHPDVKVYSGLTNYFPSDPGAQDPRSPAVTETVWAVEAGGDTRPVLRNEIDAQGCRHYALDTSAE